MPNNQKSNDKIEKKIRKACRANNQDYHIER
jgi:hypothetical protein